jgi:ATP-dependent Clp protease ATP-binding subunit ClpA
MLERFSPDAREAVELARQEARRLHHGYVGCEHLLLALSARTGIPAAGALAACGLHPVGLREQMVQLVSRSGAALDADALACLGIDLDTVRHAAEASFGPGALDHRRGRRRCSGEDGRPPFTPRAKESLAIAVRTAGKLKDHQISTGHLLLGVIAQRDNAALQMLRTAGVKPGTLRHELASRMAA